MIYDFFMHFATALCEYVFSRDTYYGYYGYGYGYYYGYYCYAWNIRPGKKQGRVVEKRAETNWDQEKIPESNIWISSDILLFWHIFLAVHYTGLRGVEADLHPRVK